MARKDNPALLWNAVPWYVGDGSKISTPTTEDVAAGRQYLLDLLELMPHVTVVLAMGKNAQAAVRGADQVMTEPGVALVECPHPGPIPAGVTKGKSLTEVHAAFMAAAATACAHESEKKGPHV
jgi:uracil-DNA glycosylase